MVNLSVIPDWARLETNNFDLMPIPVRFNGLDGKFKMGTDDFGIDIEIKPLYFRWATQSHFQVFGKINDFLCVVTLKNDAGINVYASFCALNVHKINICACRLKLQACKATVHILDESDKPVAKEFWSVKVAETALLNEEEGKKNIELARNSDFSNYEFDEEEFYDLE